MAGYTGPDPLKRRANYAGLTETYGAEGAGLFDQPDRSASLGFDEQQRRLESTLVRGRQAGGANPFAQRAGIQAQAGARARGAAMGTQVRAAEDISASELAQQQAAAQMGMYADQQLAREREQAAYQAMLQNELNAQSGFDQAVESALWQFGGKMASTVTSGAAGGASAGAMSDRRLKENIRGAVPAPQDELLGELDPYTYDYKPEAGQRPGRRYGVMAQDLEESELGRSIVLDQPDGKRIDTNGAVPVILGLLGRLAQRVEDVERGGGRRA